MAPWRLTLFALLLSACGKGTSPTAPSASGGEAPVAGEVASAGASAPMGAREAAQWERAKDGDPEEAMRLADLVGCEGLRERASRAELRPTAIAAMRYCTDFTELPWLAQLATGADDADARAALEVAVDLAARPRRSTDPEDADELHTGCGALLELARSADRPRERRVLAVRALRMLAERGCVKLADIPGDLGAR